MSVPHFHFRCGILRCLFGPLICAVPLHAADEPKKVLSTTTVNVGDHAVIFQRVEPPKETPVSAQDVNSATMSAVPTEARVAQWKQWSETHETLSLSCTVYDTGVTEVRWFVGDAEYRVLSSIDFNNLRGIGSFSEDGRSYSVFLGVGNAMSSSTLTRLRDEGAKLPASLKAAAPPVSAEVLASLQKPGLSRYVVLAAPEKVSADAYRGIDALHRYYDGHAAEVIATYQQSEADRAAHEQWLKDHPPGPPPDTIIQFWPGKGSRYLKPTADVIAADSTAPITAGKEGR